MLKRKHFIFVTKINLMNKTLRTLFYLVWHVNTVVRETTFCVVRMYHCLLFKYRLKNNIGNQVNLNIHATIYLYIYINQQVRGKIILIKLHTNLQVYDLINLIEFILVFNFGKHVIINYKHIIIKNSLKMQLGLKTNSSISLR